ncbi:aminotransferase class V-fold PLP-dependent enzyme [Nocardia stercoris]|uniref:Aminotransferase class V-fold PLP-dependent enzyme n=1 Tax=Nocardia stercoris TaxID=2483361 RepID=A0A3M2LEN5_9NOCA|nr:aminotransferase class V-fold PLP-dependent enzyme [Nocardia stercoris]RMI35043.1 aminotransferase class V-fold PLP-dependent enzyme [Nocardia stercoris]
MRALADGEFRTETTYLNTASYGLPPQRGLTAVQDVLREWSAGRATPADQDDRVDVLRDRFAALLSGATAADVAVGSSVGALIGPVAAGLPAGAEVLVAEGDFASVPNPFRYRGDLRVRSVPLAELVDRVRPGTALVAVSLTQSADGRTVDRAALRAATHAHGARLLYDATQAAGWLPLTFADADYWVCATFKWLLGARSVSLLAAAPEAAADLRPVGPGWYAAQDRWTEIYAPERLADTTRRFDDTPDWLGVVAAVAGLDVVHETTVDAIHAHDLALATRFRKGLTDLDLTPVPGDSPIVAIPGAASANDRLAAAGVIASARAGGLRFSFHLHNTAEDVDRALDVLAR